MKKVAFLKSDKTMEDRVAILPKHLKNIDNVMEIYIEKGYANHIGFYDSEYEKLGANIISSKEELKDMDVIIDPKIGDANYISELRDGMILFGYFHAVQNKELTDILISKKMKCYAWEDMFDGATHLFGFNNILAGYASVMHATTMWGQLIKNKKVAILGRGNTAIGAIKALSLLGADIDVYGRNGESDFTKKLNTYDVVINAVLWDVTRDDYLISKKDLKKMKKRSLIIDISCDINGAIETSMPRELSNPICIIDDIFHYSLSNSPTLYALDASDFFGNTITPYINLLISSKSNSILDGALIIDNGVVIDDRINKHQNRL